MSQMFSVARFQPDGSLDLTFGSGGEATIPVRSGHIGPVVRSASIAVDPCSDDIVVAGTVAHEQHPDMKFPAMIRLTAQGALDSRFHGDGRVIFEKIRYGFFLEENELLDLIGNRPGTFFDRGAIVTDLNFPVERVNLTIPIRGGLSAVAVDHSGRMMMAGSARVIRPEDAGDSNPPDTSTLLGPTFFLMRCNRDGTLDDAFQGGIVLERFSLDRPRESARALAIDSNHQILVAGTLLARYNQDGTLDRSFGEDGIVRPILNDQSYSITQVCLDNQCRIVMLGKISGEDGSMVTRYYPDGTVDTSFGDDGIALTRFPGWETTIGKDVAIAKDGRIVVTETVKNGEDEARFGVLQLRPNGELDRQFGRDGRVLIHFPGNKFAFPVAIVVDRRGNIVIGGSTFREWTSEPRRRHRQYALARCRPDGSLDPSFGVDGRVNTSFATLPQDGDIVGHSLAIDRRDRILLGGVGSVI